MAVRDTCLIAFEQIREQVGPDEMAVYEVLAEIGPAHDRRILEALNQKEKQKPPGVRREWQINQVTGRRNGLLLKRLIVDMGSFRGIWCGEKKTYHFWRITGEWRTPAGWEKVEKNLRPRPAPPHGPKQKKCHIPKDLFSYGKAS